MNRHGTNRFVAHFLHMVLAIYILILGVYWDTQLQMLVGQTYYPYPYIFYIVCFPFLLGVVLAMPKFIILLKSRGNWRFDWIKFTAMGIPTLFVAISPILYFSPIGEYIPQIRLVITRSLIPQIVCAIIFSYQLLSSLYKQQN